MTDILNIKSKAHSKDLKEDSRIFYTQYNVIVIFLMYSLTAPID